jgi:histidinol dehydrogenase
VLRRIDLRGRVSGPRLDPPTARLLPRAELDVERALDAVRGVCDAVRERGAEAVREATRRFDGVDLDELRVPGEALTGALEALDPHVRAALEESARRTRRVCEAQRREDVTVEVVPGQTVTERHVPVRRVGLYVPGGRVAYPSSVVMNVVPAQVAGVESLAVASPPQADGLPHAAILAACALLGVSEVYRVGGAQAVALFAHGTAEDDRAAAVEPVDIVTGPGNVYVAAAKRLLRSVVAIDSEAGPTEIAVLADATAVPEHVAADLVSQAEHDPLAAALLVTDSVELADAVDVELGKQVPATRNREVVEAALAGQGGVVLVDDVDAGLAVVDAWAAEHLEVITADADAVAARVRNAGAVFVGPMTPVTLGDYLAGSNHVLPTGGTARHTAGLSVDTFLRGIHVVRASREALAEAAPAISALAAAEALHAHADAVTVRVASDRTAR